MGFRYAAAGPDLQLVIVGLPLEPQKEAQSRERLSVCWTRYQEPLIVALVSTELVSPNLDITNSNGHFGMSSGSRTSCIERRVQSEAFMERNAQLSLLMLIPGLLAHDCRCVKLFD